MRVKSDAPKVAADSAPATRSATPDSASAPGPSGEAGEGEDSTDAASVATSTTKAQSTKGKTASSTSRDAAKSSNVVGRLTNLVSTDLATLPQGFTYNALSSYLVHLPHSVFGVHIMHSSLPVSDHDYYVSDRLAFTAGLEVSVIIHYSSRY